MRFAFITAFCARLLHTAEHKVSHRAKKVSHLFSSLFCAQQKPNSTITEKNQSTVCLFVCWSYLNCCNHFQGWRTLVIIHACIVWTHRPGYNLSEFIYCCKVCTSNHRTTSTTTKTDTTVDHFTQANFRSVLNVRFSWRDHHNFTGSQYMVLHNY